MQSEDPSQDSSLSPIDSELVFDWTSAESVPAAVIDAVAEFTDEEPTEMPALYSAVDPDALDTVVESPRTGPALNELVVEFLFNEVRVRLSANGNGVVRSELAS